MIASKNIQRKLTTFLPIFVYIRFCYYMQKRRGGFSAKVIHTHTKVPLKYYKIIYFHSNLPLFMLKRVFGQNNEKIILLLEKINFSCTNSCYAEANIYIYIYMNREERKHEHGLCQIAVFTFIEYDTQTMCKYVRTKFQKQSLNIFLK